MIRYETVIGSVLESELLDWRLGMKAIASIALATVAVAALSGGAMAADLYVPPAAAPVVAPVASGWDGPYIGATLGYGWQSLATPVTATTGNGWSVGGQIGYNAHLSDNIVGGVEGNLDWVNYAQTAGPSTYSVNWDGSLRARLGVDMGQWMPYAEVGVAFANVTEGAAAAEGRTGWTAGAGVEVMLADHLSANLEYRYTDYGSGTGSQLTDNSVRIGLNYHF
jgi:opacity protein-like surface antigen